MKSLAGATLLAGVALALSSAAVPAQIAGFTAARAREQGALEQRFLSLPHRDSARNWAERLAARPHLSGTAGAAATAELLRATLGAMGFEVQVDSYSVWLPHPGTVSLELIVPQRGALATRETATRAAIAADAPELAAWHAYAGAADVIGDVVYASYGLAADYAALARRGIDVRGRIVLARYGRAYRGVKVEQAERRGAAGILLYTDAAADGWRAGDTVPVGAFRPASSLQRGTVMYMWRYTGDPLTPGVAAVAGAPRLAPQQATNLPRIPAVPISSADADRLRALLAAGNVRLRMQVRQDVAQRTIRNVIARLPGRGAQEIVIGNHYDAWVFGGVDPHSGTAAMLELARSLSRLGGDGWRPERGITLAFWDAEEFGVIGSTEWVEEHYRDLRENTVAYFNIDTFTAGLLDVSGSHSLTALVSGAADAVGDPVTGRSAGELWRERLARRDRHAPVPRLGEIGAGSDWTAFLHFAGIPSVQWSMNGRGRYGVYHSVHDDAAYHGRFADSAFVHAPVMASVMGVAALRLANADALPFRYSTTADRVAAYLAHAERRHRRTLDSLGLTLAATSAAAARLREAALAFERAQADALARGAALDASNALLPRVEQAFLSPEGLPGRPWYRHSISAPGRETGYDALPIPAILEALQQKDARRFRSADVALRSVLGRATDVLDHATRSLR